MATAPQAFTRRVKERVAPEENPVVTFVLRTEDEDDEGNPIILREDRFDASFPTEEQMLVLFAQGGRSDATTADETAAMFDIFKSILPPAQYRLLMRRFKDPTDVDVDAEALADVFEWLLEQWQSFPTSPQSASSVSRPSSGAKSTGRVRGKGSIR